MDTLPPELVTYIIKESTTSDLRQLRATTKRLSALVFPSAFREITVVNTVQSAQGLANLLRHARISGTIETFTFIEKDEVDEQELFDNIEVALSHLHLAHGLRQISLFFDVDSVTEWPDEPSAQLRLQWTVLAGLAKSVASRSLSLLRHLSIAGLLPYNNPSWPLLRPYFEGLHSLSLEIICHDSEGGFGDENLNEFFDLVLIPRILQPCTELQTLVLKSRNTMAGIIPALEFKSLSYRHLTSLSIENIIFGQPSWQPSEGAEDFIVRHGRTLTSLELQDCGLFMHDTADVPERYWSGIWGHFATTLAALVHLRVDFRASPRSEEGHVLYFRQDDVYGLLGVHETLPGDERDTPAFETLKSIVDARAAKHAHSTQ